MPVYPGALCPTLLPKDLQARGAGAWGRRFRLPTDSFTDPQGAVLVAVFREPHQKLRYWRNGRRSLSGKKAGGKGPAAESTRRRLRPGFQGCSRRSLRKITPRKRKLHRPPQIVEPRGKLRFEPIQFERVRPRTPMVLLHAPERAADRKFAEPWLHQIASQRRIFPNVA